MFKFNEAVSLQVYVGDPNEKSDRAMSALLKMGKLDIAALERAFEGR